MTRLRFQPSSFMLRCDSLVMGLEADMLEADMFPCPSIQHSKPIPKDTGPSLEIGTGTVRGQAA